MKFKFIVMLLLLCGIIAPAVSHTVETESVVIPQEHGRGWQPETFVVDIDKNIEQAQESDNQASWQRKKAIIGTTIVLGIAAYCIYFVINKILELESQHSYKFHRSSMNNPLGLPGFDDDFTELKNRMLQARMKISW